MTRILLLFFLATSWTSGFAQTSTMSAITPPSPEALSLTRTDFSDVNLYTGKVNYTLPLYTIKSGNLSFPIALNYSGGNGIKVSEMASSVGLGWNLTYTGLVTRSIRGIADDQYAGDYRGYIHLPDFPSRSDPNYFDINEKYGSNRYDGQPDEFTLSVAGMSASFYINKQKKPVYVEKTELIVRPIFTGYAITSFEVTATDGKIYYFADTEDSRTITPGVTYETTDYSVSSWYLTKVVSEYGVELLHFYYAPKTEYFSTQFLVAPYQFSHTSGFFNETETSNTIMYLRKPVLRRIAFPDGEVALKMGANFRLDLNADKYIDSVIFKKSNGEAIKKYHFNYSYFTESGVVPDGTIILSGNTTVRLKLDSLTEISAIGQKREYTFEYNQDSYLPDRNFSCSMDHWGYSNGKLNTTLEARHRVKYYDTHSVPPIVTIDTLVGEFGSADRKPDINYARAGILQKVNLPTGGNIQYSYELHSSADDRLPNSIGLISSAFTLDEQPNSFTMAMLKEPFGNLTVRALTGAGLRIIYSIYGSTDIYMYSPIYTDTISGSHAQRTFRLRNGNYLLKAKLDIPHPDPGFDYAPTFRVETETLLLNKPVGGLRIKTITLNDPVTTSGYTRNYYYNEDGDNGSSTSTGTIANAPQYGVQRIAVFSDTYDETPLSIPLFFPMGYVRQLTSQYPLSVTQSSHVGYGKVTVVDGNELKTEHRFTSFKDFLETSDGYRFVSNDAALKIDGVAYETFPHAPYDDRDYLRGRPTQATWYKKMSTGTFEKIKKQTNTYGFNMGMKLRGPGYTMQSVLPDTMQTIWGILFGKSVESQFTKSYRLYTGRYDLIRTVETLYDGTDSLKTQTEYEYGDSPNYRDSVFHYQPTKVTRMGSDGAIITEKMYYPYNWRLGLSEWSSADIDTLKLLENANRIGIPVIKKTERDAALVSKVRNDHGLFALSSGGLLGLKAVKVWNTSTLGYEERIRINRYDLNGNVLEQQQVGGAPTSYLYSYKGQYPIAEFKNTTFSAIESVIGTSTIASFSNSIPSDKAAIDGFLSPLTTQHRSSYVYEPLIGLNSQTDVKGMTTHYGYDDFNRLEHVKDQNGDIIKSYRYHQLGDAPVFTNVAVSQSFTKNDCTSGTGTAVTYSIAAGAYTASSQSAADALANSALLAGGQAYANANGSCTVSSVSVSYQNKTKVSGGVPSGSISALYIKNGSGTIVYSFNNAQLAAGISIAPGTYTLGFVVDGSAYDSSTQLGWGMVTVTAPSGYHYFNYNGSSGGNYSLSGVNLNGTSTIKLEKIGVE